MKLSVFTVIAIMVYLLGVYNNAPVMVKTYEEILKVIAPSSNFPGLPVVIIFMTTAFAIRLYMHAWALDESKRFRKAKTKIHSCKKGVEWLLRLLWVSGMAWLPEFFGQCSNTGGAIVGVSPQIYVFILASFVFVWDLVMMKTVFEYAREEVKRLLPILWISLDGLMVATLSFPVLLEYPFVSNVLGDWSLVLSAGGVPIAGSIALVQMYLWYEYIRDEVKSSYRYC